MKTKATNALGVLFLVGVFICIFTVHGFAFDEQDEAAWSKLIEEHPITIDPAGGKSGFIGIASVDTTPYYVRYNSYYPLHNDIYFKIPRNFLFQLSNIAYGKSRPVVFFRVQMLYPSFSGATSDTLPQFNFRSWNKSPNLIRIGGPVPDNGHANKTVFSQENVAGQQEAKYGLKKVTHHPIGKVTDAYFVDDSQLGPVIIICNRPNTDALPICTVQVNITDDYILKYQYHRNLLPHWKEIHQHVLDFIRSSLRKQ